MLRFRKLYIATVHVDTVNVSITLNFICYFRNRKMAVFTDASMPNFIIRFTPLILQTNQTVSMSCTEKSEIDVMSQKCAGQPQHVPQNAYWVS